MSASTGGETIFAEALRLPPEERGGYIAQSTLGRPEMRREIEVLLQAYEAGEFLEQAASPGLRPAAPAAAQLTEKPGDVIGRFKLLQQIGEGGCGVVYMAEQLEPVRRRVALKIIKLGMDTKSVIARFEAERQALALMDHPNIAKVLDAGATDTGRPYFVMELVRGTKITDFCDERRLSTRQRLDLFIQVCHAIQHAHQKGIIHRDIKPSNILVSEDDGVVVPKVIDFGIAKVTGGQLLTDKTVFTAFEQFVGTPAYMSPEQSLLTNADIDTRCDIYALGVLLYELLTGRTPFDTDELLKIGLNEMCRTIREKEPPRPSTRLSTLPGQELSTAAQHRGLDAPKLITELRGDLDWVIMKALEKDRARRYETANALGADVQRHLHNEPVVACPPSRIYRFGKWARRNRLAVASIGAIAASLALGLALATLSFMRERAARKRADEQTAIARVVNEFLQDSFMSEPGGGSSPAALFVPDPLSSSVRAALRRASQRISYRFKDRPLEEAAVRMAVGAALAGSGETRRALPHLRRAVELRRTGLAPDHAETLKSMNKLAMALWEDGQREQGVSLLKKTLELQKSRLGLDSRDTLNTLNDLASVYRKAARLDLALPLHQEALSRKETALGADDPDTLHSMNDLALAYLDSGDLAPALPLLERMAALQKARLGPEDPDTLHSMHNLAFVYLRAGKPERAVQLLEETIFLRTKSLGPGDPETAASMFSLALVHLNMNRQEPALPLLEEALRLRTANPGADHPATLKTLQVLAAAYRMDGRDTDAEQLFDGALAASVKKESTTAILLRLRGALRARWGEWIEAAADLARAREIQPEDPEIWHQLAALLVANGPSSAYREHCRKSLERFSGTTGLNTAERIAKDCLVLPASGVNLETVSKMVDTAAAVSNHWATPWFQLAKGLCEYRQGRFAGAIEWAAKTGPDKGERGLQVQMVLAMAYCRLGRIPEARASFARGAEIEKGMPKLKEGDLGDGWVDWIFAHALFREAKALLQGAGDTNSEAL